MQEEDKETELTLGRLCDVLQLDERFVLNVYQYGSRVYGTSSVLSDWDFTIVVADEYRKARTPEEKTMRNGNIDVNIYNQTEFIGLIRDHDMRALISIFLPPHNVWKSVIDFNPHFSFDPALLKKPVSIMSRTALGYANICQREGLLRKAKKNLVHALRYLLYGIQIARDGRISDYTVANHYFIELHLDDPTPLEGDDKKEGRLENEGGEKEEEEERNDKEWAELRKLYKERAKALDKELEKYLPSTGKSEARLQKRIRWNEKRKMQRREKRYGTASVSERNEDEDVEEEDSSLSTPSSAAESSTSEQLSNLILYYCFHRIPEWQ